MPKTIEEEYLNSLWEATAEKQEEPILLGSKIIKEAQQRPTYGQLAASGAPVSGRVAAATVQLANSPSSPLRGTIAGLVASGKLDANQSLSRQSSSPLQSRSTGRGKLNSSSHRDSPSHGSRDAAALNSTAFIGTGTWNEDSDPGSAFLQATTGPAFGDVDGSVDDGAVVLNAAALRQEIDGVVSHVTAAQQEWEDADLAANKAQQTVENMQQQLSNLHEEQSQLENASPAQPERMRKVQGWILETEVALLAAEQLVEARRAEAAAREAVLRAAEAELDFMADARQALDATFAADEDARRGVMAALKEREERAARGYLVKLQREADKLAELQAEQEALREKKIAAAEDARERALECLSKSMARVKRNLERGRQQVEAQQAARRHAVLGLKESLGKVREEVRQKAVLYQQLQKQRREQREQEFSALLEAGQNPYAVHRQRDLEAQATRQRKALRARIEARQVELAAKMAKEEEDFQRKLAAAEVEKQSLAKFQKEQGVQSQQDKVDEYMRTHTVTGQAMLDPTGRLPVDPSAAVVAKTHELGTGRSSKALIDKLTRKHPDVKPKEMLIPNKYRDDDDYGDEDDDEDWDGLGSEENGGGFGGKSRGGATERSAAASSAWMTHRSRDGDIGDPGLMMMGGPGSTGEGQGKDGWKQLEQRPLTKFERQAMETAKARHKESIAAPKVMMGKEFGGDAFITAPQEVVFKDFDVGRTYTAKVAVTNRSYAKNTYRVLEVPPEYGNVLEVAAPLPGHLATGASGYLTITFTPKVNEDIDTHLAMLAGTGPFKIPIKCLCKKAVLVTNTPNVDFYPGITLGETGYETLALTNEGALDVEFTLTCQDDGDAMSSNDTLQASDKDTARQQQQGNTAVNSLTAPPFSISPKTGTLQGYSNIKFKVSFCPAESMEFTRKLVITYKSPANRRLVVPPTEVIIQGTGRELPIFLERAVIDFKCVMVDHAYREKLSIRNGGKTAMKVSVANRPNISDYIQFSPDFGFVQAGQEFPITIQFKPRASMLEQCQKWLTDPSGSQIEVPFKLVVPDQKLPVYFTVKAHITTTDLLFSPPALDFGPCVMAEDTGCVLRVTNPSALPQTFGFVNLPPAIRVMPNDGFGYVLPGETITRIVSFQPPIPGPQSLVITAKTVAGRTFNLPVSAVGVQPSLSLSHNKITFPATPVNDVRSCSVILKNNTATAQAFEFGVPRDSGLAFIPHVGQVPPAQTFRIQIQYQPTRDEPSTYMTVSASQVLDVGGNGGGAPASTHPAAATSSPSKAGSKQQIKPSHDADASNQQGNTSSDNLQLDDAFGTYDDGDEGPISDPLSWYQWKHVSVPCFIRPPTTTNASGRRSSSDGVGHDTSRSRPPSSCGVVIPGSSPAAGEAQVLHLNIVTCAVNPDLVLRTDLKWNHNKRCYELDFGPVPVGHRVVRHIELVNQGVETIPLSQDPLDHHQIFATVAAWRSLPPGGKKKCLIAFQPQARAQYLEVLTIKSRRAQIRVALKGQGIAPQLQLEPPEILRTGLDLGDIAKGETGEASFKVTNVCPFPLSWAARCNGLVDPNPKNRAPFFCRPTMGTLAQGEACEVTVVFSPYRQRPYYSDVLQLVVPNQQEELKIQLKGRCWEEGVFISGPEYPMSIEDPFLETDLATLATQAFKQQQQAAAAAAAAATPDTAGSRPMSPQPGAVGGSSAAEAVMSAAVTPAIIGGPGAPSPIMALPHGVVPMAPVSDRPDVTSSTGRTLTSTFPHAIYLGETACLTLEAGSLRSVAFGGAPGEVTIDGLTPAATAAGWRIDNVKVAVTAGEKKTITVTYTAPTEVHSGMAGLFGLAEYIELRLSAVLKGGNPAPATPAGRQVTLVLRVKVLPSNRSGMEDPPTGVLPPGAVLDSKPAGKDIGKRSMKR